MGLILRRQKRDSNGLTADSNNQCNTGNQPKEANMTKSFYAIFDGVVFTPEENIELTPNKRYLIKIDDKPKQKSIKNVLQRISERAIDLGISDLSVQHDHYLYGTEKR